MVVAVVNSLLYHDLVTFGLMTPFLFLLAKKSSAFLPITHFVELRQPIPTSKAQFVQVFLLKASSFRLARQGMLLQPSTVLCNLSFLIHSSLLSDCRRAVSFKFFDTQVPSVFTEEFNFFLTLFVSSFFFAATNIVFA